MRFVRLAEIIGIIMRPHEMWYNIVMSGKRMDMLDYIVLCVNEFAKAHGLAYQDSFGYLYKNKGLEFLMDFFPQESTLSLQVALDDLKTVCANNGGVLA